MVGMYLEVELSNYSNLKGHANVWSAWALQVLAVQANGQ